MRAGELSYVIILTRRARSTDCAMVAGSGFGCSNRPTSGMSTQKIDEIVDRADARDIDQRACRTFSRINRLRAAITEDQAIDGEEPEQPFHRRAEAGGAHLRLVSSHGMNTSVTSEPNSTSTPISFCGIERSIA